MNQSQNILYLGEQDKDAIEFAKLISQQVRFLPSDLRFDLQFVDSLNYWRGLDLAQTHAHLSSSVVIDLDDPNNEVCLVETARLKMLKRPFQRKNAFVIVGSLLDDEEIAGALENDWGVDLFVNKPFVPRLFAAQFRATVQTLRYPGYRMTKVDDLSIDYEFGFVWRGNEQLELDINEYRLLIHIINGGTSIDAPNKAFGVVKQTDRQDLTTLYESLSKKTGKDFKP